MSLPLLSLIACAAMAANDVTATLLTIAEAKGRALAAGMLDPAGTIARLVFYSYSGDSLLHGHGAAGWLAFAPVLFIDFATTTASTRFGNRHLERKGNPHRITVSRNLAPVVRIVPGAERAAA